MFIDVVVDAARAVRAGLGPGWGVVVCTVALSGCGLLKPEVHHVVQVREVQVPVVVPMVTPADAASRQMLGWIDELKGLSPEALVQEAGRLGDGSASPAQGMRLALVLGLTRNPGDLVRAQQVLDAVLRNLAASAAGPVPLLASPPPAMPTAEVSPDWQPWARWLQTRYQLERRLEEQIDRQGAQLRDAQRRQDQLNEKLEALKAIERQLVAPRRGTEVKPR